MDQRFLLKLENGLQIDTSNYKSIRRLAGEWSSLDQGARQLVMTRLLLAFKNRAAKSELLPVLEKLAKQENLLIKDVKDPESKESPSSNKFLKMLGIGAAVATGLSAYNLHKAMKNLNKEIKTAANS